MGLPVTLILLAVWLVLAYRAWQRGDLMLAGVLLAAGVILTLFRMRRLNRRALTPPPPDDPTRR
jgi:hypothetical protein